MTPLQYYHQQLDSGLIEKDPQQLEAMQELQRIYTELLKQESGRKQFFSQLVRSVKPTKTIKGLYLWGSVGVGKTFMMDIFFHCLPINKIRLHFHQFMQRTHEELTQLQGQKNPLDIIAKKLAKETRIICFDEFFVSNIADAMLLGGLLKSFFNNGICLIASSNVQPDDLYKNGIQRENFLPAIDLIKKYTTVFHMVSHHDYRLEHVTQAGVYFTPLNNESEQHMEKSFQHFSNHTPGTEGMIEIYGRSVKIRKQAGDTIWFDFTDICGIPRSQKDFLYVAQHYRTVLISNIPVIDKNENNLITSFINLIDVLYDARIKLVISAQTHVEALYPEGRMRFAFARAQSRLIEMQSADYFANTQVSKS